MKKIITLSLVLLSFVLNAEELYILNSISETISKYDFADDNLIEHFVELGQSPNCAPNKLEFWDNYIYAVITYENAIQKINIQNPNDSEYIFIENSSSPNDLAIDDGQIYVTGNDTYKLYKINLNHPENIEEVTIGKGPESILLNDFYAFVFNSGYDIPSSSYEQGTISVVNKDDLSIENTVNTHTNPRSGIIIGDKMHVFCSGDYADILGKIQIYNLGDFSLEHEIDVNGTPLMGKVLGDNIIVSMAWPSETIVYDKDTFEIVHSIDEDIFVDGTFISTYDDKIAFLNPGNYVGNSNVTVFSSLDFINPVLEFEAGVGATDIKFYPGVVSNETEVNNLISVNLFPNPAKNYLRVASNSRDIELQKIDIYNLKGQRVHSQGLKKSEIVNTTSLTSGMYFSRILTSKGRYINRKIMIIK